MESALFLLRLGRGGGTTDVDLRACAHFVTDNPGWSVMEVVLARGDTGIDLRTSGGGSLTGCWHIRRVAGRLTAIDPASRVGIRDVVTMAELLALIAETEAGYVVAA